MKTLSVIYWFKGMTNFLKLGDPKTSITEKGFVSFEVFDCFCRNSYIIVYFIVILVNQ